MIDKKDIIDAITLLKITYPNSLRDIGETELKMMIEVWYNDFKNTTKEDFNKAIQEIRYTNKYFPSIADIKEKLAKTKVNLPDAEDEWQDVLRAVRQFGSWDEEGALNSLEPYTRKIVKYIGFNRICMATPEEQTWNKKEFIGEYNSLKDKVVEHTQLGVSETKLLNE